MKSLIIDGKKKSAEINSETSSRVRAYCDKFNTQPKISLVQVGEMEDSSRYLKAKAKLAGSLGIQVEMTRIAQTTSPYDLKAHLTEISKDTNGILVQFPLPNQLNEEDVISWIEPSLEIDGIHSKHIEEIKSGNFSSTILPCTPAGILELARVGRKLLDLSEDFRDVTITVCGRSKLVGYPTRLIFEQLGADVRVCHSGTSDAERLHNLMDSDISVIAVGKPGFVKGNHLKSGSIVIDVGINYDLSGVMVGDVDFETASEVAGAITPVPGGVGPMTLAMLMRNVIIAAENQKLNLNKK